MKKDQEPLHAKLEYIFTHINSLLRFAELKHVGLITLNLGVIAGIASSYANIANSLNSTTMIMCVIFLVISLLLGVISQFPVTKYEIFLTSKTNKPNLYFYKHIARLNVSDFLQEVTKDIVGYTPSRLEADLAHEIVVNSKIANGKFQLFKIASSLTLIGVGVLGFSTMIKQLM